MASCRVFLVTEVRVYKVNGHYYTDASFAKILERYNKSFDSLSIATRIINEKEVRNGYVQIDKYCCSFDNVGSQIKFIIKRAPQSVLGHLREADLVVMRLPSLVSIKVYRLTRKYSKRYLTEVMGCAWDAYWNHSLKGKIIAPFMFFKTKSIVYKANYCTYVTKKFLQKRYPNNNMSIGVSDVEISSVDKPKEYNRFNKADITMMTAAAVNVKYKGQQYVIKSINTLKTKYGINAKYYLAGRGSNDRLKRIARKCGVEDDVIFLGMLSHEELAKYMREVDIYIQPSLQEGLPRSVVEAMSHGTICLGCDTGGIPELLNKKQIFSKRSTRAIVEVVLETINSNKLCSISKQNTIAAKEYLAEVLDKKRASFYDKVRRDVQLGNKSSEFSKITLVINKLIGGGAERVTCNLANYLCKNGYSVDVIVKSDIDKSYALDDKVKRINIFRKYKKLNKLQKIIIERIEIKKYLKAHPEVSCFIVMMPLSAFILVSLRRFTKAKIIVAERNNPASYNYREKAMMKYAVSKCDGLIVQTKEISKWYNNKRKKIVIQNAINDDIVFPVRRNREMKIVSVGRLEKQKNFPLLIEAFNAFNKVYPDYTLEIYGIGSEKEMIKRMIDEFGLNNKIKLMGYVEDIPSSIVNASCFVIPSNYEGMPNALIEAMCIGLPCISTDFDGGGAKELIKNGINGVLVKKGDIDGLSSAMLKVIEDDAFSKNIANEAKKMRQILDSKTIYGKWMRFIRTIIKDER